MSAPVVPCAWWHRTPRVEPLDVVRISAEALERGEVVPAPASTLLARALREYLSGQTDITRNLGLRPRKGGRNEAPLSREKREERDTKIRDLYALLPGNSAERAEEVAVLLRAPPGSGRVTETEVRTLLQRLHAEHGGDLPTSKRQVQRLVRHS